MNVFFVAQFVAHDIEVAAKKDIVAKEGITPICYQWASLVYLKNGSIENDNNLIENAIWPATLGKKNWLFYSYSSSPAAEKSMPTARRIMSRVAMVSTDESRVRCGVSNSPALMRRATSAAS